MWKQTTLLVVLFVLIVSVWGVGAEALTSPTGNSQAQGQAASPITPSNIETLATYKHIGVVWSISGDTDLDSQMSLQFRKQGSSAWQNGAMAMRAYPTIEVQGAPLNKDYWAASALFLEAGTTYELKLTLTDPDGGGQIQTVTATTRTWPSPDATGRDLYVVPGSSGGDGSQGNPFQGLQTAADAAQAGDTFHVAAGTYAPFQLFNSGTDGHPITFVGETATSAGSVQAVIDGGNTDRGIITLGEYDQTLSHVIISGFTLQDGAWGIDAQHTNNIYIHHNTIQDVDFGVYNRRADGVEFNQTICHNTINGRVTWPNSGIPSERGIALRGEGNVICHNVVQNFGDCVSMQPSSSDMTNGNDIYGNDALYCVDDGIEIDYNYANVRVWRNRVTNTRMGVSVQPIFGGPAYIFRNQLFNQESVPIKMHNQPSGFIVVHNTAVKHGNGHGDNGQQWRNAIFRNNLFLGTRYAFEFTTTPDEGFRDLDYNAWGTSRSTSDPFFKWNNVRYDLITDLPSGVEDHGVAADFSHLSNATLPADWNVAANPASLDLRLLNGTPEINAGTSLDNLNDPFVLSGVPDMGAFEFGEPLPQYGPLAETAVIDQSTITVNDVTPQLNELVTFTLKLQNTGTPFSGVVQMTTTLPSELTYQSSSLTADFGTVDESSAPILTWTGSPDALSTVMIQFAAMVNSGVPEMVTQTAVFDAGSDGSVLLEVVVVVNGRSVYLPIVAKQG